MTKEGRKLSNLLLKKKKKRKSHTNFCTDNTDINKIAKRGTLKNDIPLVHVDKLFRELGASWEQGRRITKELGNKAAEK